VAIPLVTAQPEPPQAILARAERMHKATKRRNVMFAVVGSTDNFPIIEEALFRGLNILITEVYLPLSYATAVELYIRALDRRLNAGLPVETVGCAVVFNVGTLDALANNQLSNNIRAAQSRGDVARVSASDRLIGKVGIAVAKIIYRRFRETFLSERFTRLKDQGASIQSLVWANLEPAQANIHRRKYIDALAEPETVLLLEGKIFALADEAPSPADLLNPLEVISQAEGLGVEMDMLSRRLTGDADEALTEYFQKALARVEGKRGALTTGFMRRQSLVLGMYQKEVEETLRRLRVQKSISRTWARDYTLWKSTADVGLVIQARLDWLTLPTDGRVDQARLHALREEARSGQWDYVVLLGMGESTLPAEVLYRVLGKQEGFPTLIVLGSTHPQTVRRVEERIDLERTLFVVATKSGTTLETLALQRYFFAKYGADAGQHFIAITDLDSKMDNDARALYFRHVFSNPADIGGRYSALSYFGLVPAALAGLSFENLLAAAAEMQTANATNVMGNNHPGLWLGTVMGVLARNGRDKLVLLSNPRIAPFLDWLEGLIAESLGKDGKGIVPVAGGSPGMPHDYNDDRLLVYLRLDDASDNPDEEVTRLQEAGHPLVTLSLRDVHDLGAEFYRWQFATAVAAMVLAVNPFDEPDIQQTKANTLQLLKLFGQTPQLTTHKPIFTEEGISLVADEETGRLLYALQDQHRYQASPMENLIAGFISLARSGDYIGMLAYLDPTPETLAALDTARRRIRHILRRAVTVGFGPRHLHTTGQLHKGGPRTAVLLQLTNDDDFDLEVPVAGYGFVAMKQAQADGDLEALQNYGQRVIRVHLSTDVEAGLQKIINAVEAVGQKRA
jgi:transaldolase / glucose-6-phosphate isomerase